MDPATMSALINAGSKVIGSAMTPPPAPSQRADGYAMGGMLDGRSSNSTTSGAYGGAYSQANIDGSNWVVSTGRSQATGGGTSGGNGGFTPTQTNSQGGMSTPSPFSILNSAMPGMGGGNSGLMLAGLAVLAYMILKR